MDMDTQAKFSADLHSGRNHRKGILFLAIVFTVFIQALGLGPQAGYGSQPYELRFASPIAQPWRITTYPELQTRGLRCIAEDDAGNMWFGVKDGAVRYDGVNWKTFGVADGLTGGAVESIATRGDGSIVAATRTGLIQKRDQDAPWEKIFPKATDARILVTFVIEASDGALWACCEWGLVKVHDDRSTLFTSQDFVGVARGKNAFDSVMAIPDRCFTLASFTEGTGIALVGRIVAQLSDESPAKAAGLRVGDAILQIQGEASTQPSSLRRDPNQPTVLIVERFDSGWQETVSFTTSAIDSKYRSPVMHSVMQDSRGRIWAGVKGGRLCMTQDGGMTWETWKREDGLVVGKNPAAMETSDGEIWVISSSRTHGLCRFDGSNWTATKLSMLTGPNYASAAAQTVDGTIWVSGLNRLHLWRYGEWNTYDTRNLRLPGDSHRMFIDSHDALWIAGFGQQAVRIAMSFDEFLSLENATYECTEADGTQWLIDSQTKRIVKFDGTQAVSYGIEDGAIHHAEGIVAVPGKGVVAFGSHAGVAAVSTFDGKEWTRVEFPMIAQSCRGRDFWWRAMDASGSLLREIGMRRNLAA